MKTLDKNYEELIKIKTWNDVANILINSNSARKDDRKLLLEYYHSIHHMTLDEAFRSSEVPLPGTITRIARRLKAVNNSLKYDKSEQANKYKEIGLIVPHVVNII